MKTIEEIRNYHAIEAGYSNFNGLLRDFSISPFDFNKINDKVIQAYADQQVSIAVEKALELAIEKGRAKYGSTPIGDYPIIDKHSILSLKPQILEELKGVDGER